MGCKPQKPLKIKVRKEPLTDDEIAAAMAILHVEGEIPAAGGEEGSEDVNADWESNLEVPETAVLRPALRVKVRAGMQRSEWIRRGLQLHG